MKVNKIPLEQRLTRIKEGYPGDPDFIVSAIKSMANIPIRVYLNSFEKERIRLRQILNITEEEEKEMTYKDVAIRIKKRRKDREEAVRILAAPVKRCYEERNYAYGNGTENPY